MSTDYNPYTPPQPLDTFQPATSRRPGALTAICVIAIILGGIGLLVAFGGLVSNLLMPWIQSAVSPPATGSGPLQVQAEMQSEVNRITNRFMPLNLALVAFHLPIAACLLVGGIMSVNGKRKGRRILAGACVAAILFVVAQTIVGLFVQWQTVGVMSEYMPRMIAAQPGGANSQAAQNFVSSMMSVGGYVGIAISVAIALAKLTFYALSAAYLKKAETRAYFGDT